MLVEFKITLTDAIDSDPDLNAILESVCLMQLESNMSLIERIFKKKWEGQQANLTGFLRQCLFKIPAK